MRFINSAALLGLLVICYSGKAQVSNKGKHFYLGYAHTANDMIMVLYLSTDQAASVNIKINNTTWTKHYQIPANSVITTEEIPNHGINNARIMTEGKSDRSIEIESDVPIVAYAHLYYQASSGAALLLPTEAYGSTYTAITARQHLDSLSASSWFYIVASEDSTTIEITPAAPTKGGHDANVPFTVQLNKGEIYNVMGAGIDRYEGYDLTGSRVRAISASGRSCKPFALFSGNSRTRFCEPNSNKINGIGGADGSDFIMQQDFPQRAWGRRYLATPHVDRYENKTFATGVYRIVTSDPNTVVKMNGKRLSGLVNNTYYEVYTNDPCYFESDKPVSVAQYFISNECYSGDSIKTSLFGQDPEMIFLSPIEQGIKKINFYNTAKENIQSNFVNLIIPSTGLTTLKIDGKSAFDFVVPHPYLAGYSCLVQKLDTGQHIITSEKQFNAITYGMTGYETYGYNAGTLVQDITLSPEIKNVYSENKTDSNMSCAGTPFQLRFSSIFRPLSINWSMPDQAFDKHTITLINPLPVDSFTQGLTVYYLYQPSDTIICSRAGDYTGVITVITQPSDECETTGIIEHHLTIRPAFQPQFMYRFSGCQYDTIHFETSYPSNDTILHLSWDIGSTRVNESLKHSLAANTGNDIRASLMVTSIMGCRGEDEKTILVHVIPTAKFQSTNSACQFETISFRDISNSASGNIVKRVWTFDNEYTDSTASSNELRYAFLSYGKKQTHLTVTSSFGCNSEKFTLPMDINPAPTADFVLPQQVCFPGDTLQVINTSTIAEADQNSIDYLWDFGDNTTSTSTSPNHLYRNNQTYTIELTATSSKKCTARRTGSFSAFVQKPIAGMVIDSPYCVENKLTIYDNSIANMGQLSAYEWFIDDQLISLQKNWENIFLKPGDINLKHLVRSTTGCSSDTGSRVIAIQPIPFVHTEKVLIVDQYENTRLKATAFGQPLIFQWSPNKYIDSVDILNPTAQPLENTLYTIKAINTFGCSASDTLSVIVMKYIDEHIIPNAFSPNGDGINDVWLIPGMANYTSARLTVYSRVGNIVHTQSGSISPWDGKLNGQPLPVATYYYILEMYSPRRKKMAGSVTIIR